MLGVVVDVPIVGSCLKIWRTKYERCECKINKCGDVQGGVRNIVIDWDAADVGMGDRRDDGDRDVNGISYSINIDVCRVMVDVDVAGAGSGEVGG